MNYKAMLRCQAVPQINARRHQHLYRPRWNESIFWARSGRSHGKLTINTSHPYHQKIWLTSPGGIELTKRYPRTYGSALLLAFCFLLICLEYEYENSRFAVFIILNRIWVWESCFVLLITLYRIWVWESCFVVLHSIWVWESCFVLFTDFIEYEYESLAWCFLLLCIEYECENLTLCFLLFCTLLCV